MTTDEILHAARDALRAAQQDCMGAPDCLETHMLRHLRRHLTRNDPPREGPDVHLRKGGS